MMDDYGLINSNLIGFSLYFQQQGPIDHDITLSSHLARGGTL